VTKVPKAWELGEPSCSHFSSFILRMTLIRNLTILLVAKSRSSLPDVALSVGNIPCSVSGRIPVIIQCSLTFNSRFSSLLSGRSSRNSSYWIGQPHLVPLRHLTDARFVGRLLWNIHSSANVPSHLSRLLLASEPAPQAKCQKCRRHGIRCTGPFDSILFRGVHFEHY